MRDRALQRQHRRKLVRVRREARDLLGALEAHVIVAMRRLRRAAGVDAIDLRRDLIAGPEPRLADHRDRVIGVVGRESLRVAQAELFERIPDPVVGAGLGEMVAARLVVAMLLVDDFEKDLGHGVDRGEVLEGAAEHDDAGAVEHRGGPFRHHLAASHRFARGGADGGAVVDGHVGDDFRGERIFRGVGPAFHKRLEIFEPAALRVKPDLRRAARDLRVVFHGRVLPR